MTVVNNLIRQARQYPPPEELTINNTQVDAIAEHCRALMYLSPLPSETAKIADSIRRGEMKFMAIPVRVLGAPKA